MCMSSPDAPPPPPERQAMQSPTDDLTGKSPFRKRRSGFWASVLTGAQGTGGPPMVTGSMGNVTGG